MSKCIGHRSDCGCATCLGFRFPNQEPDPDAKAAADELAAAEQLDAEEAEREQREHERDYGGVLGADGQVHSDADPGL